jgi:hypothetical protein
MTQTPIEHIRHPRLLDLAVYPTMIVMASISLVLVPDPATRVVAVALCVAFGVVHKLGFWTAINQRRILAYFVVQTILITAFVVVTHTSDPFTFAFFLLSIQAMTVFTQRFGIAWLALIYAIRWLFLHRIGSSVQI